MEQKKRHIMPPDEDVRGAVKRIIASQEFANSARLQDFLAYIVEEKIGGRGGEIKGKTVAVAVYGREIDEAGSAQNLVRVEARRLRRALGQFYLTEGQSESLRITVKAGSYTPSFDTVSPGDEAEDIAEAQIVEAVKSPVSNSHWVSRPVLIFSIALLSSLVIMAGAIIFRDGPIVASAQPVQENRPKLAALTERSVASVQSYNISQQARGMFFPLFDRTRQEIALDSFRHAISLDPDLPSGYAGAAQIFALLSLMSPDAVTSSDLLAQAQDMAARGLERGPTDGWAQAAQAWTLAVEGNVDDAMKRARIAYDLSPEDGHVLDLIGIAAILAGDAALAATVSDPTRFRSGVGRFGANSIWGASQLMLKNYPATVEAFSTAAERGLPVSAPSLMLLATAYNASGDAVAAEKNIDEMMKTWPGFPAENVVSRFLSRDQETLERVLQTYRAYTTED